MENINFGTALSLSILGFLIVFIVLVLLMTIIYVMGAIMKAVNKKNEAVAEMPTKTGAPAAPAEPAKGSCGDLTLVKVSERDAAMIMAITADQLKTPLNELRFISIKEAE